MLQDRCPRGHPAAFATSAADIVGLLEEPGEVVVIATGHGRAVDGRLSSAGCSPGTCRSPPSSDGRNYLGFDKITPTRVMTGDLPIAILKPGSQSVWSQRRRA